MANPQNPVDQINLNNGKLFKKKICLLFILIFIDNRVNRLGSSLLNLLPTSKSTQRDRLTFRTAFVHSAALLFILVCGACALLAYRVLEPFLRSILWSILAGAFLFPFKNHLTQISRDYLRQLDTDSHLLFYGLVILLPLRTVDRTIESIFPFSIRKWKQLLVLLLFLLSIVLLQTGVVYRWLITIGYDCINTFVLIVHIFDSPWMTTLVIAYIIAVLTIYDSSPLISACLVYFNDLSFTLSSGYLSISCSYFIDCSNSCRFCCGS
jgi:hypothetical protein